jgi:rubrerythrin
MHKMTEQALREAFAGESQAHMKYTIFADQAAREGLPQLSRLFTAIAYAERVHAENHFRALGDLGAEESNIQTCVDGETYEIDEMYPAFNAIAKLQGEAEAVRSTHYAWEAERIHAEMYEKAKAVVGAGEDLGISDIQICSVCGHTREGDAPEKCPICGAAREKFVQF